MKKKLLLKILAIGIFIFFISANITSSMIGNIENKKKTAYANILQTTLSSITDWWPMFGHDINHSRYSTSKTPNSCCLLWSFTTGGVISSSPAVAYGKVYVSSFEGKIYCLSASNGIEIWNYTSHQTSSSPAVAYGKVYLGANDKNVYCLDGETGKLLWNYTTGNWQVLSSPTVAYGKVYIGGGDDNVYCLDAETGKRIWNYTTDFFGVEASPAVDNGKVYVGSSDKFYCLDAETGNQIWNYTGDYLGISSSAVADGKVYVGSLTGKVYSLDAETGGFLWSFYTGGGIYSSPAVAYGKIYIGSDFGNLYCLDAATGDLAWSTSTGNIGFCSPAVADGKVYIGSRNKLVYCLDAETGGYIWNYITGDSIYSSPAIADGKVFIGSDDFKLYCFGANIPLINGPSWGIINNDYIFCFTVTDPEENNFYCKWDWGDGNISEWLGPYTCSQNICGSHTWNKRGIYKIRVKLRDEYSQESNWSDPFVFKVYELKNSLLYGKYTNMTTEGNYSIIKAVNLYMILFRPLQYLHYKFGEKIIFLKNNSKALITPQFIIGMVYVVI